MLHFEIIWFHDPLWHTKLCGAWQWDSVLCNASRVAEGCHSVLQPGKWWYGKPATHKQVWGSEGTDKQNIAKSKPAISWISCRCLLVYQLHYIHLHSIILLLIAIICFILLLQHSWSWKKMTPFPPALFEDPRIRGASNGFGFFASQKVVILQVSGGKMTGQPGL